MKKSPKRKQHILITGGAGFIGSHLCEAFLAQGFAVTAVDNFVTGSPKNVRSLIKNPDFKLVRWDVSEKWPLAKIPFLKKYGLAGLLHFACPASPTDFDRIPFEILKVDSLGTFHALELALHYRARFILASTSEIYGDPLEHPQKESYWGNVNTLGPRACYDETKRFAEAAVSTAIRGVGKFESKKYTPLNGAMVRIFNTYGPRMRPQDGRLVPELIHQALAGKSLTITGDGSQTRSFCFVSDLVEGIVKLYHSKLKRPVNIGNPHEMSVLEFANEIQKISGKNLTITRLPERLDDPRKRRPDITLARTELQWEPRISFDEGIRRTWDFFKQSSRHA